MDKKDLIHWLKVRARPFTPCIIGDEVKTQLFSKRLIEGGVYAKSIVFPTVPRGTGRVRNMLTAAIQK